jgi:hypothetical protein
LYGLYRAPDAGGVNFWTQAAINSGWAVGDDNFNNSFFYSAYNSGDYGDGVRCQTSSKSYIPVSPPFYGDFQDRPV